MKVVRAQLFLQHPAARRILDEIINYISASFANPALWEIIQRLAQEKIDKLVEKEKDAAPKATDFNAILPYELGAPGTFFYIDLFLSLSSKLSQSYDSESNGGLLHPIGEAFELMLEKGILDIPYAVFNRDAYRGIQPTPRNQAYRLNKDFAQYLISNKLIYNHLFGFDYIIDKYARSVVKIEVKHGEDMALGTGWLFDLPIPTHSGHPIRLVVTNNHVLAGSSLIKVLDRFDHVIPHYQTELLLDATGVDIALLLIDYDESTPAFLLHPTVPLLEEVITIGYPTVPLAREAYQLVHRGEVNAHVTDYYGQELLIISARTAPGNSGSPVIDDTGRVVGMIAQQLFEKAAFEQKGITPYSACIPASIIQQVVYQTLPSWLNHGV